MAGNAAVLLRDVPCWWHQRLACVVCLASLVYRVCHTRGCSYARVPTNQNTRTRSRTRAVTRIGQLIWRQACRPWRRVCARAVKSCAYVRPNWLCIRSRAVAVLTAIAVKVTHAINQCQSMQRVGWVGGSIAPALTNVLILFSVKR